MTSILTHCYKVIIIDPLKYLYLQGPRMFNIGFWEGKPIHEICGEMSSESELFWLMHINECAQMIDDKFFSYVTMMEIGVYFYLMIIVLHNVTTLCFDSIRHRLGMTDSKRLLN